jgi:hypothetical protein
MIIETIGEFTRETLELGTETSKFFKSNGELIRIKVGTAGDFGDRMQRISGTTLSTRS